MDYLCVECHAYSDGAHSLGYACYPKTGLLAEANRAWRSAVLSTRTDAYTVR